MLTWQPFAAWLTRWIVVPAGTCAKMSCGTPAPTALTHATRDTTRGRHTGSRSAHSFSRSATAVGNAARSTVVRISDGELAIRSIDRPSRANRAATAAMKPTGCHDDGRHIAS